MSDTCKTLNVRPIKVSELANYPSLKSDDIILTIQSNGSNLYSRKTTFGDFVSSITQLTSSLSGNLTGEFTGAMSGALVGNLTGSVLGGNLKGKFVGIGSITGDPFTTLNGSDISFKGTSSYSVSSSYSPVSSYSINNLSSSYSLTSSFTVNNYAKNAKSSSFAYTSSLAILAKKAIHSDTADNSTHATSCDEATRSIYAEITSNSDYSKVANSSSYAYTSSYARSGSFAKSSSFAQVSNYALKSPPSNFGMEYFSTYNEAGKDFQDIYLLASKENIATQDWTQVFIQGIPGICDCSGTTPTTSLSPTTRYIYVTFQFANKEDQKPLLGWCADINDPTQSKILIDKFNSNVGDANISILYRTSHVILPVKSGTVASFYYKIDKINTGEGSVAYRSVKIYITGYVTTCVCKS